MGSWFDVEKRNLTNSEAPSESVGGRQIESEDLFAKLDLTYLGASFQFALTQIIELQIAMTEIARLEN